MGFDWRNMDDATIAQHYSPRASIPDAEARIANLAVMGAQARERIEGWYDLRYGPGPREVYDCHPTNGLAFGTPPPILIYLHGGFWRALEKSEFSWIAPPWTRAGAQIVNVDYDLCPDVTVDEIVDQIARAVVHVYRNGADLGGDPGRIVIAGHSAGAHLVAMLLRRDWARDGMAGDVVKAGICVSGIYEPEVVMRLPINDDVRLDKAMAARNDCLREPPRRAVPLLVAVGGGEPEGWTDQSQRYAELARSAGLAPEYLIVPGTDHFSVGEAMADSESPLFQAMWRILASI